MTYTRLYKSFKKFIDQDEHFTEQEQDKILESFKNKKNRKIFRLSIILLIWSFFGITIDSFLIGGGILGTILKGLSLKYVWPTIIFSITNFIIKTTFVRFYMKKEIPLKQIALAGIPYVGSGTLIRYLINNDVLYSQGIQHYLRYLKKRGIKFVISLATKK
jgi:uncharacterized membrane protein (DUF485 family)